MPDAECRFVVEVVGVRLDAEETIKAEIALIAANLPDVLRVAVSLVESEEE